VTASTFALWAPGVFGALAPSVFAALFIIVMFSLIFAGAVWVLRRDRTHQQHRRSREAPRRS
jgi:uncharacterized protein (DUF2062 family)